MTELEKMAYTKAFVDKLAELGESRGLSIHAMHEDIFNTMHHI